MDYPRNKNGKISLFGLVIFIGTLSIILRFFYAFIGIVLQTHGLKINNKKDMYNRR